MKSWERDVLEYRPVVGYTPDILSIVTKLQADGSHSSAAVFTPSVMAQQATVVLATDLVDQLTETLEAAKGILSGLAKGLSSSPVYTSYREAVISGDAAAAEMIHLENMKDIAGSTPMDVIPILEETIADMESFLEYINRELFDGTADFSDMDRLREAEQNAIDSIYYLEAANRNVNYEELAGRLHMLLACSERIASQQYVIEQISGYLYRSFKDIVDGDASGAVYYLSGMNEAALAPLQTILEMGFRPPAEQAANMTQAMKRVGQQELKTMLDTKLSEVKSLLKTVYEPLLPYYKSDTIDSTGAETIKGILNEGIDILHRTFEKVSVEHIGNSILNRDHTETLFAYMNSKKDRQLLYNTVSTFHSEFDPIDLDKEVLRFIKQQGLLNDGSLLG
jgi:hypothetical protein